jgi:hypothetical protein
MVNQSMPRDLFDRWEREWHEGRFDLVPECVGPNYIRHDEVGDRTVTREAYAAEIDKVHEERPGIRVVVCDHAFQNNRAWFRSPSSGRIPKREQSEHPPECNHIGLKTASWSRLAINAAARLRMDGNTAGTLDKPVALTRLSVTLCR